MISAELLTEAGLGLTTIGILCGIAKRQGSIETKVDTLVVANVDQKTINRTVTEKLTDHEARLRVAEDGQPADVRPAKRIPLRQTAI